LSCIATAASICACVMIAVFTSMSPSRSRRLTIDA